MVSWLGQTNGVAFVILSGVVAFLAKSFYELYLARRKERLERVNQQLRLLYGPLFALVNASSITWGEFVRQYCTDPD
jgi:hypothetical protein